ncbi:hypothetical protein PENTCL1PPCAC_27751 [Pristionchus entomophagus]|uniref:Uncharacterized protein n=1 Tax=Pristionchus entomophagus TaxID=358040 RepID=A0AAV5UGY3_9BILA|nr:hypothetical protein PENTCL1PPCAC_27747 [Pristionchus entomophagus]GMT05577.1 hypothetical protein PENTCL1PPCAC_27751 [Pristionchus entomophagus]
MRGYQLRLLLFDLHTKKLDERSDRRALYEYSEYDDYYRRGYHHILSQDHFLVEGLHQSIADGSSESSIGNNSLIDEGDPLHSLAIGDVCEGNDH